MDPCLYISKSMSELVLYWVDGIVAVCQTTGKMNKVNQDTTINHIVPVASFENFKALIFSRLKSYRTLEC